MASDTNIHTSPGAAKGGVPPMRDLAFSMLALLVDAAATQLRVTTPGLATAAESAPADGPVDMREARAAIDAANALLAAVRDVLDMDALRAFEGMLTQLQIEYVRHAGRGS